MTPTSKIIRNSKLLKIDVQKILKELKEKNNNIIKSYQESIEKLKSIKLHKHFQTSDKHYLIDIYHNLTEMDNWKYKCINEETFLMKNYEKIITNLKNLKEKVFIEKKQKLDILKKDLNITISKENNNENESFKKLDASFKNYFKLFFKKYNEIRINLVSFFKHEKAITDFSQQYEMELTAFLDTTTKELKYFTTLINSKNDIIELLIRLNKQTQSLIQSSFKNIISIGAGIEAEIINLDNIKNNYIPSVELKFSYLLNPTLLPLAYEEAMYEIKRRKKINNKIRKSVDSLKVIAQEENDKRKEFTKKYGKILPNNFIPCLKYSAPDVKLQIYDSDLDNIDIEYSESDDCDINNNNSITQNLSNSNIFNNDIELKYKTIIKNKNNEIQRLTDKLNFIEEISQKSYNDNNYCEEDFEVFNNNKYRPKILQLLNDNSKVIKDKFISLFDYHINNLKKENKDIMLNLDIMESNFEKELVSIKESNDGKLKKYKFEVENLEKVNYRNEEIIYKLENNLDKLKQELKILSDKNSQLLIENSKLENDFKNYIRDKEDNENQKKFNDKIKILEKKLSKECSNIINITNNSVKNEYVTNNKYRNLEEDNNKLKITILSLTEQLDDIRDKYNILEIELKNKTLHYNQIENNTKKHINNFKENILCLYDTTNNSIYNLTGKFNNFSNILSNSKSIITNLLEKYNTLIACLKNKNNTINELKQEIEVLKGEIEGIKNENFELLETIREYKLKQEQNKIIVNQSIDKSTNVTTSNYSSNEIFFIKLNPKLYTPLNYTNNIDNTYLLNIEALDRKVRIELLEDNYIIKCNINKISEIKKDKLSMFYDEIYNNLSETIHLIEAEYDTIKFYKISKYSLKLI